MLNELIKRLNGHSTDAASLMQALEQLRGDRDATRNSLTELKVRRHQALLDDAADPVIDRLDRDIDRAQTKLEKLDLAEPDLRARLAAAEVQARNAAAPALVAECTAAFEDYCTALKALAAAHRKHTDIRERGRKILGDARAAVLMPPFTYMGILTSEHIDQWIARNAVDIRASEAMTRARTPAAEISAAPAARLGPRQRLPHEPQPSGLPQGPVSLDYRALPAAPQATRTPDDLAPLEPGEARVRALRAGFSPADDRPQCAYMQVVRMPAGAAERSANAGVVEILEVALPAAGGASASQGQGGPSVGAPNV